MNAAPQELIDRGNALEDAGEIDGALENYRAAAALAPAYPRAHLNIGNALIRQNNVDEAIRAYQTAQRLDPSYAPARFNLGNLYASRGSHQLAEHEYREALRLAPQMVDAAIALANVLEARQNVADAEQALRQALRIDPRHAGATHNLRHLLNRQERWDEALGVYEQLVAIAPSSTACAGLAGQLVQMGDLRAAERFFRQALAADPIAAAAHSDLLFSLNLRDDLDPPAIFREHRNFAATFEPLRQEPNEPLAPRDSARRLKVGYLSGDFRQHPVALLLRPLLKHHDRAAFETFCYCNNAATDQRTRELQSLVEHWRDIRDLDDVPAARMIRSDGIDILVDLSGHTPGTRFLLFPLRCAPLQLTWLGYLNTTGLEATDFRICDRHTDPPGMSEHLHSERLYRLPHSQWCYAPTDDIAPIEVCLIEARKHVVFGSFNGFPKISGAALNCWCDVLRSVPDSELRILGVPKGRVTANLLERFEERGIDAERVAVQPRVQTSQYFRTIGDVDIALDTFPYNGATTTLDTLWMGVPIVGLEGDRSIARGTYSILSTLGMPELIARDHAGFVDRNVRLASDIGWRRELRRTLRPRMEASPLMDGQRFARDVEDGYRAMLLERVAEMQADWQKAVGRAKGWA